MRQRAFEFFNGPYGLSDELITTAGDRTFAAGQGNWSVEAGSDVSWDNTDCDWNCGGVNNIRLAVTLTQGAVYKIGVEITAYTSGDLNASLGANNGAVADEETGTFIVYIQADASNYMQFWATDFIGSIDNISLKRVL